MARTPADLVARQDRRILKMLAKGMRVAAIARQLALSTRHVRRRIALMKSHYQAIRDRRPDP
jgi:DNA-binding NarL/FixJ family response regulator